MKYIRYGLFIAIFYPLLFASAVPVYAQSLKPELQYTDSVDVIVQKYDQINALFAFQTRTLLYPDLYGGGQKNMDVYVDLYSKTSQYDPLGTQTQDELYKYAYAYSIAKKQNDKDVAIRDFRILLEAHMGNFEAVTAAVALTKEYPELYELKKLQDVRAAMIKRLMNSGTGNTLGTAYLAYTAAEETFVLLMRNADLLGTEPLTVDDQSYNIERVVNRKTGEPETIYFNVSAAQRKKLRDEMIQRALTLEQRPYPVFKLNPLD